MWSAEGGALVLNEEQAAIDTILRRKWDTAGGALLGADLGTLVQGSHELQQNVMVPSGVSEPITSSLLALALAALVGTFLFTAITVTHNIIAMRLGRKTPAAVLVYHRDDVAFAGAILGVLLVLAHEAFNFLSGRWQTDFLFSRSVHPHCVGTHHCRSWWRGVVQGGCEDPWLGCGLERERKLLRLTSGRPPDQPTFRQPISVQ